MIISVSHLISRMQDRQLLAHYFKVAGGRYLPAPNQSTHLADDQEFSGFKTSLPQIEMNKRLLVNIEREFSDRRYDVRIFEITIKHARNEKKY